MQNRQKTTVNVKDLVNKYNSTKPSTVMPVDPKKASIRERVAATRAKLKGSHDKKI